MKREILFRGKVTKVPQYMQDKNRKRVSILTFVMSVGDWVYGSYVDYPVAQIFDLEDEYIVDPATVGQFTGLTDKNGVKIFEGDIVRFSEWSGGEFCWIGTVFYKFCSFTVEGGASKECDGDFAFPLSRIPSKRIEIIGNIHDTPELAKEESE